MDEQCRPELPEPCPEPSARTREELANFMRDRDLGSLERLLGELQQETLNAIRKVRGNGNVPDDATEDYLNDAVLRLIENNFERGTEYLEKGALQTRKDLVRVLVTICRRRMVDAARRRTVRGSSTSLHGEDGEELFEGGDASASPVWRVEEQELIAIVRERLVDPLVRRAIELRMEGREWADVHALLKAEGHDLSMWKLAPVDGLRRRVQGALARVGATLSILRPLLADGEPAGGGAGPVLRA